MDRTIRVTGKGKVSVSPDTIRIDITAESTFPEYEETVGKSAEHTGQLRETVAGAGLDPKDLKTLSFEINASYENYTDKHNNWKKKFVGYKYIHRMYIEFPNDNKLLGKVLYELSKCPVEVEFQIGYTVKDTEAVKNQLLEYAVADASAKAGTIAKAAGVELGEIASIDYSWSEMRLFTRPIGEKMSVSFDGLYDCNDAGFDIDIEADDIEAEDTVTIVWQICQRI